MGDGTSHGPLERHLRARRADGRKFFMPYLTAGYGADWPRLVEAVAAAGADAIEIGIPFSDPVMDGPTIQVSSAAALEAGATPASILDEVEKLDVGIPLIAMTYYNIPFHMGLKRYAENLRRAGIVASILPDLPLEESGPWCTEADAAGIETVMLAAPTASDERLSRICARARGFVYAVGLLGITGEREQLAASALDIAGRLTRLTDVPVAVGVGVSTPEQAAQTCEVADGVVVGSAIIQRLTDHGFDACVELVGEFRERIDRG
ncbi:tryptophan synthase subunit alpha [Actinomarinicola tropica]|uniref:Tryptophan synthase alpha chain n=1 Tax=Actinomarinicola tropica TaxID=2789776 RepID=A0A5Q2RF67_9ACTN|nr:tryptophan synthase subunit alpha [Actinomarinicola tropica]QGG95498.1 tryptophan synthase subunit alpha [Actinomarinicola tropica]